MELDPQALIDNNIIALQSLKESIRKNQQIKESTDTFVLTKAVLKALIIFDANNTCMTVNECADFLKCHRNTITNRIHNNEIKAIIFLLVFSA